MDKKVTIIEPVLTGRYKEDVPPKRVCAYARVSTEFENQLSSFSAQVEYYSDFIQQNPAWEFVGVYADEAISGTNMLKRDDFLEMLAACNSGKIDLILTKSISRFARNTIECIQTVRELKALGVAVYFEEERINTMAEAGELLLTILSSIAQSEAEDVSSNIRWAINKRFQDGTFIISTPAYGYKNDEDGQLIIDEETAPIVKRIFHEYLNGKGTYIIAKMLERDGIPTIQCAERWSDRAVLDILKNEIYAGNALLQKKFTTEVIPFHRKRNHGEKAMYLIEDGHPSIINKEEAEAVLAIMEYRRNKYKMNSREKYKNRYVFSGRIQCRKCGSNFRRQILYGSQDKRAIRWNCRNHVLDSSKCSVKPVKETEIQSAFLNMWNKLLTNQEELLEPFLKILKGINLDQEQEQKIAASNNRIRELVKQEHIMKQIAGNGYVDPAIFMEKSNEIKYKIAEEKRRRNFIREDTSWKEEIQRTEELIGILRQSDNLLENFEEELFNISVARIIIEQDGKITFLLHNRMELTEEVRKGRT